MKHKKLFRIFVTLLSVAILYSFVTIHPAEAKANHVHSPSDEEVDKAKRFAEESLTINKDGSFKIDKKSASKIYSESEIRNIEKTFKSIDKDTLAGLYKEHGSTKVKDKRDVTPYFAPAIPIVAMGIWELLGWLGAVGASAVAAAFANDMYRHGVKSACKKFANKNKHIKSWCKHNGYL
ncbi:hypothetical protein ACFDHY_07095 [Staphylococcus hyicus]|uniref:hypothetical protein n=1 Tax=Staphylococcus hyicus TaxID=1284 RepID=UPI0023672DDF|nr:hypothetical protein [Staphylococcus hyicus]MDP4448384.1 hypothetical protein [Staphylococcus hyicus]MDP4459699.1 hypothetical protein [Staphylococcus hyicus]